MIPAHGESLGPQQGRKAFMIRTIRPLDRLDPGLERVSGELLFFNNIRQLALTALIDQY